ncbi:hypothetical protein DYD21_00425 [Rhodohalobacter sp. SW132]|uniref:tetratricopeptide repeat protein n=1 Tax=Rhodohalobacter sp. SW132 TaxID=2293433 RepID=UPI000E238BDE|nr:hypothetical protein [Rhodohalobacter sp. SW132]REL38452.1 hypothetical protein DYD21_00425 [Rhodohalobacter sp. SW132]
MTEKEISILISRYIKGELSDEEEDQLWVEFLKDSSLLKQYETELNLYDLFQNKGFSLDEAESKVENPVVSYKPWYYTAAAAILLIAGLFFFNYQFSETSSLAVTEIELTEMVGADIYREQDAATEATDLDINRAIAYALDGNVTDGYEILNNLSERELTEQQKVRVNYNLGILAYNAGDYNHSRNNFQTLFNLDGTPAYLLERSEWFTANAYLKAGDIDSAIEILEQISAGNSPFSTDAAEILRKLQTG